MGPRDANRIEVAPHLRPMGLLLSLAPEKEKKKSPALLKNEVAAATKNHVRLGSQRLVSARFKPSGCGVLCAKL